MRSLGLWMSLVLTGAVLCALVGGCAPSNPFDQLRDARIKLGGFKLTCETMDGSVVYLEQLVVGKTVKKLFVVTEPTTQYTVLVDLKQHIEWCWYTGRGTASKVPADCSGALAPQLYASLPPGIDLTALEARAAKVTPDTLDGRRCLVVETRSTDSSPGDKIWVDCMYGLPRQIQTDTGTWQYPYDQINDLHDTDFAIPADIKILDTTLQPGDVSRPNTLPQFREH